MTVDLTPFRSLYPFDSHYFDRDGLKLHYLDEGEGPPVVMVHGNPTWSFFYRDLVKSLRDSYRVIVPDHIGCGLSDKPQDDRYEYRLKSRVDDLEALIESFAFSEKITLVVHDWGGAIGMGYATRHPERIGRMVIMNTAAFPMPEDKKFPPALALVRDSSFGAWLVQRFNAFSRIATYAACKKPMDPLVRKGYIAPYDTPANRIATLRFVQDIPLRPEDPSYGEIARIHEGLAALRELPALLLWGEKDFVFDEPFLKQWIRELPGADVIRYPKAGHYVLEDAKAEAVAAIRKFIDSYQPVQPVQARPRAGQ